MCLFFDVTSTPSYCILFYTVLDLDCNLWLERSSNFILYQFYMSSWSMEEVNLHKSWHKSWPKVELALEVYIYDVIYLCCLAITVLYLRIMCIHYFKIYSNLLENITLENTTLNYNVIFHLGHSRSVQWNDWLMSSIWLFYHIIFHTYQLFWLLQYKKVQTF